VKVLARLAVFIVLTPALLLAQTSTGQSATTPKANAASAQPASSTAQAPPAPAAQTAEAPRPAAPMPYPIMSTRAKDRARQLYEYLIRGEGGPLYASFAPEMKKQYPEAKIAGLSKQVNEKLGTQGQVLSETYLPSMTAPLTLYSRTMLYSNSKTGSKTAFMAVVGVNGQGELSDMQIVQVPPTQRDQYTDYQDTTKLHLPFNGAWMVFQGGRNIFENVYASTEEDKYTVSFMFLKDGAPFENDGKRNTDFYCFGEPVLAPAAGVVVQLGANSQDHAPGKPPEMMSRGNYVVIAHGNSEYSLIRYLKGGSIKVRNGQRVKRGDVIGECGNSGSSYAPHVEYSLQNSRGFPLPKTMPAQFVDYTADGKPVTIGEPLRGQTVANQAEPPATQTAEKPR